MKSLFFSTFISRYFSIVHSLLLCAQRRHATSLYLATAGCFVLPPLVMLSLIVFAQKPTPLPFHFKCVRWLPSSPSMPPWPTMVCVTTMHQTVRNRNKIQLEGEHKMGLIENKNWIFAVRTSETCAKIHHIGNDLTTGENGRNRTKVKNQQRNETCHLWCVTCDIYGPQAIAIDEHTTRQMILSRHTHTQGPTRTRSVYLTRQSNQVKKDTLLLSIFVFHKFTSIRWYEGGGEGSGE